jgi:hypothetical protein
VTYLCCAESSAGCDLSGRMHGNINRKQLIMTLSNLSVYGSFFLNFCLLQVPLKPHLHITGAFRVFISQIACEAVASAIPSLSFDCL